MAESLAIEEDNLRNLSQRQDNSSPYKEGSQVLRDRYLEGGASFEWGAPVWEAGGEKAGH